MPRPHFFCKGTKKNHPCAFYSKKPTFLALLIHCLNQIEATPPPSSFCHTYQPPLLLTFLPIATPNT